MFIFLKWQEGACNVIISPRMTQHTTIFFDLDDTLYPPTSGVWQAIGERINLFIMRNLGGGPQEALLLRDRLWRTYGTTLRGLQELYHIDSAEYLAYVHDVPLTHYIRPDPRLRSLLTRIPQRKIIFTNADSAHARRVLNVLGVADCFDQIIDVVSIAPYCKPMPQAMQTALSLAGECPENCILVEDMPHNLAPASRLGLYTILVGREDPEKIFNAVIPSILDLESALPHEIEL